MGLKFLFCCDDCKMEETGEVGYTVYESCGFVVGYSESWESYPKGWQYDGRLLCKKCSKAVNLLEPAVSIEAGGHWGP